MRRTRRAVVAALGAVSLAVAGVAAAATSSPTAAARSCSRGVALTAHLTGSDLAYLTHYVPCLITQFSGSRPAVRRGLTTLAAADMKALEATSTQQLSARVEQLGGEVGTKYCGKPVNGLILSVDSTPPPTLTPSLLAQSLGASRMVTYERTKGLAYGFAYARSVLGHDGRTINPVAVVVIAINCNTKPVKLASR